MVKMVYTNSVFKKLVIVLLCISLVLTSMVFFSSAVFAASVTDGGPFAAISLDNVDISNRKIYTDLVVGKDSNLAAGAFSIEYDADKLSCESVEINGEAANEAEILVNKNAEENCIIVSYVNIESITDQVTLLRLTFSVKEGQYGKTTLTLFSDDAVDSDGKAINLTFRSLTLTIPQEKTISTNPFNDLKKGSYYYNAVLWAFKNNITDGVSAAKFGPAEKCTRGQVVTFLWRTKWNSTPLSFDTPFVDLAKNTYYVDAVAWAYENGITSGTTSTLFSPDATVTRAQFVTFLWRMEGKPKANVSNPFKDVQKNVFYTDAVLWAYENGITSGTTATTFEPDKPCLRAEVVTFLYRAFN